MEAAAALARRERAMRVIDEHVKNEIVPVLAEKKGLSKDAHANAGKRWSHADDQTVLDMYVARSELDDMSIALCRSPKAVKYELMKVLMSLLFADPRHAAALADLARRVNRPLDDLKKTLLVDHNGMLLRVLPRLE